jgi:AcrR family transcriptional regulator
MTRRCHDQAHPTTRFQGALRGSISRTIRDTSEVLAFGEPWVHAMHKQRGPRAYPRKRPTQSRAAHTVSAILVASARTFGERGFDAASVNVIAERAGVSIGSLYQYFPSKEALLVALAEQHTELALGTLEQLLEERAADPLPIVVRAIVTKMVESHVDPLHRVLAQGLDTLGRATTLQETIDKRATAAVVRFLRDRHAEIRKDGFELTALLLVRAVDLLTHAAVERFPASLEDGRLVNELTALVLGYLTTEANERT